MPFAATYIDLEIIILSDVNQRKTNHIPLVCRNLKKKKKTQVNLRKRNRLTDIEKKHSYQRGKE